MVNRAFDAFAARVPRVAPPLLVACHRSEDDPRFVPDAELDRATHAFGCADGALAYTGARRFAAPSGLDAVVLHHATEAGEGARAGALRRGADLLVFALGQVVARLRLAEAIAHRPADPPGPDDGTEERVPVADDFERISVERTGTDGEPASAP